MTFFRQVEGIYQEQALAPDGRYRPAHLPRLACVPARLWDALFHPDQSGAGDCHVFESAAPTVPTTLPRLRQVAHADAWDATPFAPVIGQHPTRITFDQYIAWCPEAKFEWYDDQMIINHLTAEFVHWCLHRSLGE